MTIKIRRSAGSRTFIDVLLSALRIRPLSLERDLADLKAGATLQVTSMSTTIGEVRTFKLKGQTIPVAVAGWLHLSEAGPVVWRNKRSGVETVLSAPFTLMPSERKAGHYKFARFDLTAGDEQHVIIFPKADVALVTKALENIPV